MERPFVIGTRGSKLALWQADYVARLVREAFPGIAIERKIIKTTGDKVRDVALSRIGDKGLFVKELELALAAGEVDCCVHSMKDVPTELPDGMEIAAMPPRADARDVLVAAPGTTLAGLAAGSIVGTGSLRRLAQLMAVRPDLEYRNVRGNLDTRIKHVQDGDFDASVLAAAGIIRMGWADSIAEFIDPSAIVPATGQGAVGVEIRSNDGRAREICDAICDAYTFSCVNAERHIMRVLEGGCQVPFGAYARTRDDGVFAIDSMVSYLDGTGRIAVHVEGTLDDAAALAEQATQRLVKLGAKKVLDDVRSQGMES